MTEYKTQIPIAEMVIEFRKQFRHGTLSVTYHDGEQFHGCCLEFYILVKMGHGILDWNFMYTVTRYQLVMMQDDLLALACEISVKCAAAFEIDKANVQRRK